MAKNSTVEMTTSEPSSQHLLLVRTVLRITTLWPGEKDTTLVIFLKDLLLMVTRLPLIYAFWSYTIISYYDPDENNTLASVQPAGTSTVLIIYILLFCMNRKETNKLIPGLELLEKIACPPELKTGENRMKFYAKITIIYVFINSFLLMGLSGYQYGLCLKNHPRDRCIKKMLPFHFPVDISQSWIFELMIVYWLYYQISFQIIGLFLVWLPAGAIISTLFHFRHLLRLFKSAFFSVNRTEDVRMCIEYHNAILIYCKLINSAFNNFFTFFVGSTATATSIFVFQLMEVDSVYDSLPVAIQITTYLIFVYLLIKIIQDFQDESMVIGDELYALNWEELPVSTQKVLLFIIRRCQKPAGIVTVLGPVGMDTFANLMRGAYSLIAILVNIKRA